MRFSSPQKAASQPAFSTYWNGIRSLVIFALVSRLHCANAFNVSSGLSSADLISPSHGTQEDVHQNPPRQGPPEDWDEDKRPLKITNRCGDTIWPGILTQHGTGPGTGGFELASRNSMTLWVGPTWQGRIWGRTNCTVNGNSASCRTGDCFSRLSCEFTVCQCRTSPNMTSCGQGN